MGQREELIQIFVAESQENIELLDQNIVRLEQEPENRDLLDEIFRAFHTLKGNAGIVGMSRFEKIAHITEEVLTEIRDGTRKISSSVVTFLLDSLDQLKLLHDAIESTGTDVVEVADETPAREEATPKKKRGRSTTSTKKQSARKKSPTKKKSSTGRRSSKNTEDRPSEDLVAEDGSWGIFVENIKTAARRQQDVTPEKTADPLPEMATPVEQAPKPSTTACRSKKPPDPNSKQRTTAQNWTKGESTIRVNVGLLDNLMNLVGELVLSRNQILQLTSQTDNHTLQAASQRLNHCTSELQESIMKTRMQPIANVFNRFPRLVRDVTANTNKRVQLRLEGGETELDKTIIEGIHDPLTHLVRNAIDHGIEAVDTREKAGKDPQGTLLLRAFHEGGQVNIEIIDDGAGIDPEKLRDKAVEKGFLSAQQAAALSDRDAINLIFKAGFSTAAKVTNISGRGVGMDVVKTNIDHIGGSLDISSEVGAGTTIRIKIPLTLAIIPALIVSAGHQRFAIPQINLKELIRLNHDQMQQIERVGDAETFRLRGKLLPVVRLQQILKIATDASAAPESLSIVVLNAGDFEFGIIVDQIHDTEEIVVKPLCKHLKRISAFAGATVLGDGKVVLILDVVGLADAAHMATKDTLAASEPQETTPEKPEQTRTFLLFSISNDDQFAIPAALMSRLEKIDAAEIQKAGNREMIRYRGNILPLLRIENHLHMPPPPQQESLSLIVFSVEKNEVGFVVSKIIDIVESSVNLDTTSVQQDGVLGSTIIEGRITLVVDAYALIAKEHPEWFTRKSHAGEDEQTRENPTVLIVDDSPFIRAIERSYLEPEGYHVYEANNGDEALKTMNANSIDVVITDVEMPKMDGLELTRNIRAQERFRKLPVVVVSSLGGDRDVEAGMKAGASVYLKKLNRDELVASLQQVIDTITP